MRLDRLPDRQDYSIITLRVYQSKREPGNAITRENSPINGSFRIVYY